MTPALPIQSTAEKLIRQHKKHALANNPPLMVGTSGIDGSGKGYITHQLHTALTAQGLRCHTIGCDGWLALPNKRFANSQSPLDAGEHFYRHGFRYAEMRTLLLEPLRQFGQIDYTAQHAAPDNSPHFQPYHYQIPPVDILLVEGIFLFQPAFQFDYKIWIECSFDTALQRAITRNQEGITEEQLILDYKTIYFPAQRVHFKHDNPTQQADCILNNETI